MVAAYDGAGVLGICRALEAHMSLLGGPISHTGLSRKSPDRVPSKFKSLFSVKR
jgi:hypothetical protein